MARVADFKVCIHAGDLPWEPVGAAWKNEDGSILIVMDFSREVRFMLIPRRAAAEPLKLEPDRGPDEVPNG